MNFGLDEWIVQADRMLSVEAEDGYRDSLPLGDPRMAQAWPIWLERVKAYETECLKGTERAAPQAA
jgi:hypothetical protein